jgi:hypothetical protein
MKQMNIRAEAALLEVARRHHTTVEEVRREIRLAASTMRRERLLAVR